MISAWWLIAAFVVGVNVGIFLIGLCAAGRKGHE